MNGDTFKINTSLNCDDKCFIYCVTCKQCNKQYRGETKDQFRNNCINYKDNARKFDRKESCMQEHLYKHFGSRGQKGFVNEASVIFIAICRFNLFSPALSTAIIPANNER